MIVDMPGTKCPGQDWTRKDPMTVIDEVVCVNCNYEIEFFVGDQYRDCPECGFKASKTDEQLLKDYSCADWCKGADDCLGPELYSKYLDLKQRMSSVSELSELENKL